MDDMTVEVRCDPEHVHAIGRALDALKAERSMLERWGGSSVGLTLAIDDLEELHDRIQEARQDAVAHARDPWSRKVQPLRSVS